MNKIPMQIYLDPDTVEFYKQYARKEGKSFAEAIRMAVNEKRIEITEKIKKRTSSKKKKHPFLIAMDKARRKFKNVKYHYPELSDDELLIKHELQELDS